MREEKDFGETYKIERTRWQSFDIKNSTTTLVNRRRRSWGFCAHSAEDDDGAELLV